MATSTEKYTAAAGTGVMAAIGTGLIVWALKLSKPIWKPAAFAFLIEFFTHYSEDPPVKGALEGAGKEANVHGKTLHFRHGGRLFPGREPDLNRKQSFSLMTLAKRRRGQKNFLTKLTAPKGIRTNIYIYTYIHQFLDGRP